MTNLFWGVFTVITIVMTVYMARDSWDHMKQHGVKHRTFTLVSIVSSAIVFAFSLTAGCIIATHGIDTLQIILTGE